MNKKNLKKEISKLAKNIHDGYLSYGDSMLRGNIVLPPALEQIESALITLVHFTESQIKEEKNDLSRFFHTHHPCKSCKGYVPDKAIVCMHCDTKDP